MIRQVLRELVRLVTTGEFDYEGGRSWAALGALAALAGLVIFAAFRGAGSKKEVAKLRDEMTQLVSICFHVDANTGFLDPEPLQKLPAAYDDWEAVVAKLPELNAAGKLEEAVRKLPLRSFEELPTDDLRLLHRAHVVLSLLVQSYINGPSVPWDKSSPEALAVLTSNGVTLEEIRVAQQRRRQAESVRRCSELPAVLAKPFALICGRLGLPELICCSATFDTWNWKLIDASLPISVDNIQLISTMTREPSECGFHAIPCAMQARAGPLICKLFLVDVLIQSTAAMRAVDLLDQLATMFVDFCHIFETVRHRVGVDTFYDIYRPLLSGYFPDGLTFSGVSKLPIEKSTSAIINGDGNVVSFGKGPSAGQSAMIVLFDLALGISHGAESSEFQNEMLQYMPGPHRSMLQMFEKKMRDCGNLKEFVRSYATAKGGTKLKHQQALQRAYRNCLKQFSAFRTFHLGIATKYLIRTKTGTGASDFRSMLREASKDTETCMSSVLQCPAMQSQ